MRKRITLAIMLGMSIILLSFGIASYFIVEKNIEDLLNKKLAIARLIRNEIDITIRNNINRLYDISLSGSIDLADGNFRPEKEALKAAYRYSIYTDGIFLLDKGGNVLLTYPERPRYSTLNVLSVEPIRRMIDLGKPVVSNIYTTEPTKRKVIYVLVPLKDKNGNYVGAAGGEIDPTNPMLTYMLRLIDLGKNTFVDLVDSNGIIIASSTPSRTLTSCNEDIMYGKIISERKERVETSYKGYRQGRVAGDADNRLETILAFVPLEMAPWAIAVQEPSRAIFEPAVKLKKLFIALAVIFIGTALVLTIGISRSIVDPVKELTKVTDRIAKGEMSEPVPILGTDEIGSLSRSFEAMRIKLVQSMERRKKYNQELERRVDERTRQIHESQLRVTSLLKKVISTQEEERKRIARGLHDDTVQDLSAILMHIDMCKLYPEKFSAQRINDVRNIVLKAWDGLLSIIQNLRPTLLDDLGLEAAIKRLLELNFPGDVQCFVTISGLSDTARISPETQITLFRIIQEAIANVARHSNAGSMLFILKNDGNTVNIDIEDDGDGFDARSMLQQADYDARDSRGLGLLGMKERAALIGGSLQIYSSPGCGTRITIKVPLKPIGVGNV
ncbi:MAG TPA: cache domain-containing protein [Dissulfurispiraceae bacterium]